MDEMRKPKAKPGRPDVLIRLDEVRKRREKRVKKPRKQMVKPSARRVDAMVVIADRQSLLEKLLADVKSHREAVDTAIAGANAKEKQAQAMLARGIYSAETVYALVNEAKALRLKARKLRQKAKIVETKARVTSRKRRNARRPDSK